MQTINLKKRPCLEGDFGKKKSRFYAKFDEKKMQFFSTFNEMLASVCTVVKEEQKKHGKRMILFYSKITENEFQRVKKELGKSFFPVSLNAVRGHRDYRREKLPTIETQGTPER